MSTSPVFLVSLPRSGSTLLQRMLARHSEIQTESELWFLLPHLDAIENKHSLSSYSSQTLNRATRFMLQQLPNGKADYYAAIRKMADDLYDKIGAGNKYVVDKTPRYYFILEELYQLYPDAKFIFLFRHPCAVTASLVESFNRNHLGDYTHRVDMYEGPSMLAAGYRRMKDTALAVRYEELIRNPRPVLESICDYLKISYEDSMASEFSSVPLKGLGDKFGSKQLTELSEVSLDKWKKTFNTPYRKKYLKNVIDYIGKADIDAFGYNYNEILKEIASIETRFSLSLEDRAREYRSRLYSLLDVPEAKRKFSLVCNGTRKVYINH